MILSNIKKSENSVSNVNEVFGITVPKDELAYIAEIFLL